MLKNARVHTIRLPWRKVRASLPAFALIGAGIALTAYTAPAPGSLGLADSQQSRAIVVPHTAVTMPAVAGPDAPALILPGDTNPGSSSPVVLDDMGIPVRALGAYHQAASLIDAADPICHIDWALLAAIGRVESNHARFGGNQLDSAGIARPGIIGIALNGKNGTALITDTDGGRLDRDTVYDHAVGPMQFIPTTWRVVGSDADGDGVKDPQDMADAATAAAIYLCSGPGNLSRPADLRAAIMRYNPSDSYARTVTAIADAYRHGVSALPASDLPAANTAAAPSGTADSVARPAANPASGAATATPEPTASAPKAQPTPEPSANRGSPAPAPWPTPPVPAPPVPTTPVPALPIPALPVPALTPATQSSATPLTPKI